MIDHQHQHHPQQRHHHDNNNTSTPPPIVLLWGGHRKHRTTAVIYQMYTQTMPRVLASLFLALILLTSSLWAITAAADGDGSSRRAGRQLAPAVAPAAVDSASSAYGVDCSFPIFDRDLSGCQGILGDRRSFYESYMQGCRDHFATANPKKNQSHRCDSTEQDRLDMSSRQPQSMVNYTSTGFLKIRAPNDVMDLLYRHWKQNKDKMEPEAWGVGNIYTNNWASPTYMVSVENQNLRGGGQRLKQQIWDAARSTIEQWTGMEQQPTSMYGIRVYTEGAVLAPHVDRLPLVSSAIVNLAQDLDEPWVLEVYDRHDRAVNVTMEPGDMVLYESGSLIHGRPFPLKGRYFANIFIHFEPTGRRLGQQPGDSYVPTGDLPPYLNVDTPEADHWLKMHPGGWKRPVPSAPNAAAIAQPNSPSPVGHHAAAIGDVESLAEIAAGRDRLALHAKDANGWQPIHEAVRGGHLAAVELLIKHGASKDARTGRTGQGYSPLKLARHIHSEDHPVTQYLLGIGATSYEDEEL